MKSVGSSSGLYQKIRFLFLLYYKLSEVVLQGNTIIVQKTDVPNHGKCQGDQRPFIIILK